MKKNLYAMYLTIAMVAAAFPFSFVLAADCGSNLKIFVEKMNKKDAKCLQQAASSLAVYKDIREKRTRSNSKKINAWISLFATLPPTVRNAIENSIQKQEALDANMRTKLMNFFADLKQTRANYANRYVRLSVSRCLNNIDALADAVLGVDFQKNCLEHGRHTTLLYYLSPDLSHTIKGVAPFYHQWIMLSAAQKKALYEALQQRALLDEATEENSLMKTYKIIGEIKKSIQPMKDFIKKWAPLSRDTRKKLDTVEQKQDFEKFYNIYYANENPKNNEEVKQLLQIIEAGLEKKK